MAKSDRERSEDEERDLERALEKKREDLLGDMEENRNLTGSTTYETLGDVLNDENQQHGRRTQAASPRQIDNPGRSPLEDIREAERESREKREGTDERQT